MLRALLNLFRRPTIRSGLRRDPRGRFREPGFVSFIAQSNRKSLDTDFQDAVLRGRRFVRILFKFGLAGGCAWVVLESAKAISMF